MGKRGLEMAVQIVFVILVMMVVAVLAIRMFTQQAEQVNKIAKTEQDRAKAECLAACSEDKIIEFCSKYISADLNGNRKIDLYQPQKGIYICEDKIYCPAYVDCRIGDIKLTPLVCMKYLCQYYIENGFTFEEATLDVFGKIDLYNNGIRILEEGTIKIGSRESCGGKIPTWVEKGIFGKLLAIAKKVNGDLISEDGVLKIMYEDGSKETICELLAYTSIEDLLSTQATSISTKTEEEEIPPTPQRP